MTSAMLQTFVSTSTPWSSVILGHANPKDPLESLQLEFMGWINTSRDLDALGRLHHLASRFDLRGCARDDIIHFLAAWAYTLSLAPGHQAEASHLIARALDLVGPSTPRELAWHCQTTEHLFKPFQERRKGFQILIGKITASKTPRRTSFILQYANILDAAGYLQEVHELLLSIPSAMENGAVRRRIYANSLINCDHAPHQSSLDWLSRHDGHRAFVHNNEPVHEAFFKSGNISAFNNPHDAWARSLGHLKQGRVDQALIEARMHEDIMRSARLLPVNLPHLRILVRVEAAAGQAAAVKRLIHLEHERGASHGFDPFFLSVASFREGRLEEASAHLGTALKWSKAYRAETRLLVEASLQGHEYTDWLAKYLSSWVPERASQQALKTPEPAAEMPAGDEKLFEPLLGKSEAMKAMKRQILRFSKSDVAVLIQGETGTGKELVAAALHRGSSRQSEPFVAVNCASIPENLIHSELFGHSKGAFTGADKARRGVFVEAGKGTLFLDEIGDIPPAVQVALLRALESGKIRPVGSDKEHKVACRIVTATHVNLAQRVKDGFFREDLFYRLNRIPLQVPALRDRGDDILILASYFLNLNRAKGQESRMSPTLQRFLVNQSWPGNVRELANEMEYLRVMHSDRRDYDLQDLSPRMLGSPSAFTPQQAPSHIPLSPSVASQPSPSDGKSSQHGSRRPNPARRREAILALFTSTPQLTRAEIKDALGHDLRTIVKDLHVLENSGHIRSAPFFKGGRKCYYERT